MIEEDDEEDTIYFLNSIRDFRFEEFDFDTVFENQYGSPLSIQENSSEFDVDLENLWSDVSELSSPDPEIKKRKLEPIYKDASTQTTSNTKERSYERGEYNKKRVKYVLGASRQSKPSRYIDTSQLPEPDLSHLPLPHLYHQA